MNIRSSFQKDTQTLKTKPGSYEWWYFDAISTDGYSVVIIFYDGNPFSRRYISSLESEENALAEQYPAISISIYKDNRPVFYSFEEVEPVNASFSSKKPAGNIGLSNFEGAQKGDGIEYKIELNQTLLNGDSLKGTVIFDAISVNLNESELHLSTEHPNEMHEWNLVAPKCNVTGELFLDGYHKERIDFKGFGYHDHNRGDEPMRESFRQWYWGRYHLKNSTVVYYLMEENGIWDEKAWIVEDDGKIRKMADQIDKRDPELSVFGLRCSRSISLKDGDSELFIQKERVLDSGPFYMRFFGKLIIRNGDQIETAEGISEYIYPSRIHSRIFWPLVNMRIKYPGPPHWVQKSPVLYRWTW